MQETGVSALDTTIQKTNTWIKEVMVEMGSEDRHRAYLALRSVLHLLRDRLTVEEATDLGAQLPMLIRGFYYDGWKPGDKPEKFDREEFLVRVLQQFPMDPDIDPEELARIVFRVIEKHIADGEIEDIRDSLPADLAELWTTGRTGRPA